MEKQKISILEVQKDESLLNSFIEQNFGLVRHVLRKHFSFIQIGSEDYNDYFQIGSMGLLKSIKKFSEEFGTQFSTYAASIIWGEMKRYNRDYNSEPIKITRELRANYYKYLSLKHSEMTDEEICKILKISTESLRDSIDAMKSVRSFSEVISFDGDEKERTLEDTLRSKDNVEEMVVNSLDLQSKVMVLRSYLSSKQYLILRLHLKGKSQQAIGEVVGIQQAQVSRILKLIGVKAVKISREFEFDEVG